MVAMRAGLIGNNPGNLSFFHPARPHRRVIRYPSLKLPCNMDKSINIKSHFLFKFQ
jgi:hypothetical protein